MAEESKNALVESKKKQKPKKDKGESRIKRSVSGIWAELKKVTWPAFPVVVKSVGVVLAVCAVFLVVLLGFDLLLSYFVYNPLTKGTISGGEESLRAAMSTLNGILNTIRGLKS